MYGLAIEDIEKIREVLASYKEVDKAVLYGSRAKGNYRSDSDIDIALFGENIILTVLLEIENNLDDLLLPNKIDVSNFKSIKNAALIDHINRVGITLYEKVFS